MKPYIEGFNETGKYETAEDVLKEFRDERWDGKTYQTEPIEGEAHFEIMFAVYECESYNGEAFVLYRDQRDGELYTVEASHCSCNGLEGQWEPVKTTLQAEALRLANNGRILYNDKISAKYKVFIHNLMGEIG